MNLDKNSVKKIILILFSCIVFYLAIRNLGVVAEGVSYLLGIISPFILGSCIAFIINVPMNKIEKNLFRNMDRLEKLKRPLSIVLTLILVFGIIILAMCIVIPQIGETLGTVAKRIPVAMDTLQIWLNSQNGYLKSIENISDALSINWEQFASEMSTYVKNFASGLLNVGLDAVVNIASAVVNFVIGFVFALYILLRKEKLTRQGKQVIYAVLKEDSANKLLYLLTMANKTFSRFISGQCLEAIILGLMFFATMTVIGLPYAMLVSVLIAFTALIPMVGAFIGCVFGALLILMDSPMQALIFIIMFLILQQIEGNLVYPHVVGSSVGLPSIWVLVAITLGGNLMGVLGMILFIPLTSVAYAVFRLYIKDRLQEKGIESEKWSEPVKLEEDVLLTHTKESKLFK